MRLLTPELGPNLGSYTPCEHSIKFAATSDLICNFSARFRLSCWRCISDTDLRITLAGLQLRTPEFELNVDSYTPREHSINFAEHSICPRMISTRSSLSCRNLISLSDPLTTFGGHQLSTPDLKRGIGSNTLCVDSINFVDHFNHSGTNSS